MLVTSIFFLFPTEFLLYQKEITSFKATIKLSCADAFNMDMATILSSSNELRLIDLLYAVNAVFNIISVISRRQVRLSMLSWSSLNQYASKYSYQDTGCFPTYTLSKQ